MYYVVLEVKCQAGTICLSCFHRKKFSWRPRRSHVKISEQFSMKAPNLPFPVCNCHLATVLTSNVTWSIQDLTLSSLDYILPGQTLTQRRESGQIPIRLSCCMLSSRGQKILGVLDTSRWREFDRTLSGPRDYLDRMGIKQFHLVCTLIIWCFFSSWSECFKKSLGTVVILPLVRIGN